MLKAPWSWKRSRKEKDAFGFNADTGVYEDLMKAGVIDPTKVTRFALQNAASVASLLLTTEAMVAERPKEKEPMGMPPGGGGMGGMGGMYEFPANSLKKAPGFGGFFFRPPYFTRGACNPAKFN